MKNKFTLFILVTLTLFSTNLFSQNALHFDGSDDKVDCGNDTSLQITGKFITLEAWIYPTSWKTNFWEGSIIGKESNTGDNGYMLRCGEGGRLNFNIGSAGWNELTSAGTVLSLNKWQHVAGTYDGTKMRLYLNGSPIDSIAVALSIGNAAGTPMLIGGNPNYAVRFFPGMIDEVRVWNVCRSRKEIYDNLNNEFCSPMKGLRAYYKFNQGKPGVANTQVKTLTDFSPYNNNGILWGFALDGSSSNWLKGKYLYNIKGASTSTVSKCDIYTSPSGKYRWTKSGVYYDTLQLGSFGCDSIITINLTIRKSSTVNINVFACKSYTSPSGAYTWTTSGIYKDFIKNYLNCDSIINIFLQIGGSRDTTTANVCNSYKSPKGKTYVTSGIYSDTLKDNKGCDSIVTVKLTVRNTTYSFINEQVCNKYISPSTKYTWSAKGIYMDTIKNKKNCDSVITVNLNIKSTKSILDMSACKQVKSPSGKRTWTVSGIYKDTIFNVLGCDSLMTINLTINQPTIGSKTVSACQSYRGEGKKRLWIKSGVYKDTLINANGCDSVLTVNLTIININTNVTQTTNTLTAVKPTGTYQWLNCNTSMSEVPAATNRVFNVKTSGNYAVEITDSGCVDTSTCYNVNVVSVNRLNKNNTFKIIPNPNNGVFDIQLPTECYNAIIKVRDISGRLVFEQSFDQLKQSHLQLDNIQTSGLYLIEIVSLEFNGTQYLAIER